MMFHLKQGEHFDSYQPTPVLHTEFLCNVAPETLRSVRKGDVVEIDFTGDNDFRWRGIVSRVDRRAKTIHYSLP
jgi:hypothetical protein